VERDKLEGFVTYKIGLSLWLKLLGLFEEG